MKFDIFLSICQTEVDGYLPSERVMFENFFDQVELADHLGFGTAWVAETHLSCEIQKKTSHAVIPHFKGEIGLNTDILQLAHQIFRRTKRLHVGSAVRNILCNGGPIAHAEAIKMFLCLHDLNAHEDRKIDIGFASGRFEFSNRPFGILPRSNVEEAAWGVVKGKVLRQATEIFLRLLEGESLSSRDVQPMVMEAQDFRSQQDWEKVSALAGMKDRIEIPPYWAFEQVGVIPKEARRDLLELTLGSHDPKAQELANKISPVKVFNLSITPPQVIEDTHERMRRCYHKRGGPWQRWYMPRTAMVFIDRTHGISLEEQSQRAKAQAHNAWENYWRAMEGTLDPKKVEQAVGNTIAGNPQEVAEQIRAKYHPEDRLMLWFDFNNHNNEQVKESMVAFMEEVTPRLS